MRRWKRTVGHGPVALILTYTILSTTIMLSMAHTVTLTTLATSDNNILDTMEPSSSSDETTDVQDSSLLEVSTALVDDTNGSKPIQRQVKGETLSNQMYDDDDDDSNPPSGCPSACNCIGSMGSPISKVLCIDSGLFRVPPKESVSPVILEYILTGNNIVRLYNGTFSNLAQLKTLDLSDNGIQELELMTFEGLDSLRELKLGSNKLRWVDWYSVLKPPTRLAILNLTDNAIGRVDGYLFEGMHLLRVLDLSANEIDEVDENAFQGLDSLVELSLANNILPSIETSMFEGLHRLTELSLEGNLITNVSENAFESVPNLRILNLSHNRISYLNPKIFEGSHKLTHLVLRHNELRSLSVDFLDVLPALGFLDLGANPIQVLSQSQFSLGRNLEEILLDNMGELVTVMEGAFADLSIRLVNLSNNARLRHISTDAFRNCVHLNVLDLSGSGLETIQSSLLSSLPALKNLSLENSHWRCDCSLQWISSLRATRPNVTLVSAQDAKCVAPPSATNWTIFDDEAYREQNCTHATVIHHSSNVSFRLGSTALLECQARGDPSPLVSWQTPHHDVLHWYPPDRIHVAASHHSFFHDSEGIPVGLPLLTRIQVLKNGNLFISPVERMDAGVYVCLADNSLGTESVHISMSLDYEILMHVKVVSILVGLATSIAFLLTMLVAQLVQMVLNRFGWCCCRENLPPKAKQIRKVLESVEHYKTQQLDRLRENYTMQVQRIKENCNQQMERLRESYSQQTERFRDIREYGTQQLNCMRDQYYEQVKRVRDYSTHRMNCVRENYVLQRNRIRKFSAHQLFKLRENYKVQQMHLNKILENLNLESCRTVCARTDSIMFTSENMETAFNSMCKLDMVSIPMDGSYTSGSLHSASHQGGHSMLHPFYLEMFDFSKIDAFPIEDEEEEEEEGESTLSDSVPTPAFVTPPETPMGSSKEEMESFGAIELDEVVTFVKDPKTTKDTVSRVEVVVVVDPLTVTV